MLLKLNSVDTGKVCVSYLLSLLLNVLKMKQNSSDLNPFLEPCEACSSFSVSSTWLFVLNEIIVKAQVIKLFARIMSPNK